MLIGRYGEQTFGCGTTSKTDTYTVVVGEAPPAKKATLMVVTDAPPDRVEVGVPFLFAGLLEDELYFVLPEKRVDLYINNVLQGSVTTGVHGEWAFDITVTAEGTYNMYAEFPGDAEYTGCP